MLNYKRVKAVLKKDLLQTINDKTMIISLMIIPVMFSIILPILIISLGFNSGIVNSLSGLNAFTHFVIKNNIGGNLNMEGKIIYSVFQYFFIPLFLLIPLLIDTVLASTGFIGEKEKRTIEGLLYTPITDSELLLAKMLASLLPSTTISWIAIFIYWFIVDIKCHKIIGIIFPNTLWLLIIVMIPLISLLAIELITIFSQYLKTSKSAQSVTGMLVFPIIAGVVSQSSGVLLINKTFILGILIVLIILDVLFFYFSVMRFNRERFLLKE